jgi:hypothetical protein
MVCDLRAAGRRILVDGEVLLENGRFLGEGYPAP